jgi:hypothetical protein
MSSIVLALVGYALGSLQVLAIDWLRSRSQHRRQVRLLRAELSRLASFRSKFGWSAGKIPATDLVPNSPRITDGYITLVQDVDFWLTDEHKDDNTQEALLNIMDGCHVLQRYAEAVLNNVATAGEATTQADKEKWRDRAITNARAYDRELDRWLIMVDSGRQDVERRLDESRTLPQILRRLKRMPKGKNPPILPPVDHD